MERSTASESCVSCKEEFKAAEEALIIMPCGDSVCFKCYSDSVQPQNSKFYCAECKEDIQLSLKFQDKITQRRKQVPGMLIYCDAHPTQIVDSHCTIHETLSCIKCAFQDHADHKALVADINWVEMIEHLGKCDAKLVSIQEEIQQMRDLIMALRGKEQGLPAEEFLQKMRRVQQVIESLAQRQEDTRGYFKKAAEMEYDKKAFEVFGLPKASIACLQQWTQAKKLELLYSIQRDEVHPQTLHQKIDNKGPTLTMIKTDTNNVFGAYTSIPWKSSREFKPERDDKAFLFANNFKYTVLKPEEAVWPHKSGIFFGQRGLDLSLNFNFQNFRCNNIGKGYAAPKGQEPGSKEAAECFAGGQNFSILEMHVYRVIS